MAIADYDTLKSALQSYAARSDSKFSAQVPTFVAMVEERLYNGSGTPGDPSYSPPLRSSTMELDTTVAVTAGSGTVPADMLEIRSITVSGQTYGLEYLPPERFKVWSASLTGSGPIYYTIIGSTISVIPAMTGTLQVLYYRRFDAINDSSNKTGSLIIAHGNIYLELGLFYAFVWMRNAELSLSHLALGRSMIEGANRRAISGRYPGPLRARSRLSESMP